MKLEIKNLKKSFGKRTLFSFLNATFESGKITAIMGKSGCGKTTLLNIIGQIEPCDEGEIIIDSIPIQTKSQARKLLKYDISFIFQSYGLLENESIEYNLSMSKRIKEMNPTKRLEIMKDALNTVNLPNILNQQAYSLSGGEQQRVAIARSIVKDAKIILADEPTASIDEDNAKIVLKLLREMASQDKIVILVTHSSEVAECADQVIFMKEKY